LTDVGSLAVAMAVMEERPLAGPERDQPEQS